MTFQASSLRVAGQDSDLMDLFFPSSEIFRSLQDVQLPPMPDKQMYGDSASIQSWIDAIDCANKSVLKLDGSDDNAFEFATHPFRACRSHSPFSDDFESDSDASFDLNSWAWAPAVLSSSPYDGSDESSSESSPSDGVQYITIPSDSPWYRPPSPSLGPVSAHELNTALYAKSCSSDVRQAIAQQQLLLAIFHTELRRSVSRDDGSEYDSDWLEDVDVDLVLEPLETYMDLCWESAICEMPPARWLERPIPDVPVGFDDI